jgi:Arc/MetJ-type ribon-helix-helix transcriptional regulator
VFLSIRIIIYSFIQIVSMAAEYTSVKVPKVLAEKISNVAIKNGIYRSVSEFMLDSARRRLDDMKK